MALIKKLGYCVGSKTTSIDFEEKKIPEKVEYKVIVKVWIILYESYNMSHIGWLINYSDRGHCQSWHWRRCSNTTHWLQQERIQKLLPVDFGIPEVHHFDRKYFWMTKSETKATKLDNFFRDDFERGKTDKFIVNMKDIGDPLLCKLGEFSEPGPPRFLTGFLEIAGIQSNLIISLSFSIFN